MVNVYGDELSGQIFVLVSGWQIMQWNPPVGIPAQPCYEAGNGKQKI